MTEGKFKLIENPEESQNSGRAGKEGSFMSRLRANIEETRQRRTTKRRRNGGEETDRGDERQQRLAQKLGGRRIDWRRELTEEETDAIKELERNFEPSAEITEQYKEAQTLLELAEDFWREAQNLPNLSDEQIMTLEALRSLANRSHATRRRAQQAEEEERRQFDEAQAEAVKALAGATKGESQETVAQERTKIGPLGEIGVREKRRSEEEMETEKKKRRGLARHGLGLQQGERKRLQGQPFPHPPTLAPWQEELKSWQEAREAAAAKKKIGRRTTTKKTTKSK